ncbi:hypothetical protein B0H13DRAFT_2303179 [Mycena leptocephala]|nr:hypothetical protein B0H13DRAFT_2303179 [Mycena leptocephala]
MHSPQPLWHPARRPPRVREPWATLRAQLAVGTAEPDPRPFTSVSIAPPSSSALHAISDSPTPTYQPRIRDAEDTGGCARE